MKPQEDKSDPDSVIGVPFFDCCVAIDVALRAARQIAELANASEIGPNLEELVAVLEVCDDRMTRLGQALDIAFETDADE